MKNIFQKSNEKIKKNTFYFKSAKNRLFLLILTALILLITFLMIYLSSRKYENLYTKKRVYLQISDLIKENKDVLLTSENPSTYIKTGEDFILKIISKKNVLMKNNLSEHFTNDILIPKFKDRTFFGKNNHMLYNEISKDLTLDGAFVLYDQSDTKYYVKGSNIVVNIKNKDSYTEDCIIFNDRDFYLSGDKFTSSNLGYYIETEGNSIFKKRNIKTLEFDFAVFANTFKIFIDKKFAEAFQNVKMKQASKDGEIISKYAKAIFKSANGKLDVDEILFLHNVYLNMPEKQTKVYADIGYYSIPLNRIYLFGNVKIENPDSISRSEEYMYTTTTGEVEAGDVANLTEEELNHKVRLRVNQISPVKISMDNKATESRIKFLFKNAS